MAKLFSCISALLVFFSGSSFGQQIEEVIVMATASANRALQPTITLHQETLAQQQAATVAELFNELPSVGIRYNSRGEAVIRLRGSEERQTALFLDGAPLSIPWDGRIDIGILPAGIIQTVRITQSAAPVEYGVNAMLGAVELSTLTNCQKIICKGQIQAGTYGLQNHHVIGGGQRGSVNFVYAGQYHRRHASPVANANSLPFAIINHRKQSNTDTKSHSFWGAIDYQGDKLSTRLSLLTVDSSRGIAAAGHLNPALKPPRYWRYPHWHLSQASLNSQVFINNNVSLKTTGWYQHFQQRIDQYSDARYQTITAQEQDRDQSWGGRIILSGEWQNLGARLIGNLQQSQHRQQDVDVTTDIQQPKAVFRQHLYSLGGEIDSRFTDSIKLSVSGSYDHSKTPESGGRPRQRDLSDWAASSALQWQASNTLTVAATIGRRSRFPTLRELYGVSLGKFVLNPQLLPETAWLADAHIQWLSQRSPLSVSVTPWRVNIDNSLAKRRVLVAGDVLQQRYNLAGSQGYGIDFSTKWTSKQAWQWQVGGSWQALSAKMDDQGNRPALLQRPRYQANITLAYPLTARVSSRLVIQKMGGAKDENIDGKIVSLGHSTRLDSQLFYDVTPRWQLVASAKNLTNESIFPQLGLPSAGRTFTLAMRFTP